MNIPGIWKKDQSCKWNFHLRLKVHFCYRDLGWFCWELITKRKTTEVATFYRSIDPSSTCPCFPSKKVNRDEWGEKSSNQDSGFPKPLHFSFKQVKTDSRWIYRVLFYSWFRVVARGTLNCDISRCMSVKTRWRNLQETAGSFMGHG